MLCLRSGRCAEKITAIGSSKHQDLLPAAKSGGALPRARDPMSRNNKNRDPLMKYVVASTALAMLLSGASVAQEKYTVALDGTFAPHAMPKLGGGVEGFNVDLATIIGERLGVEMDIVATQWSGILPGMMAGLDSHFKCDTELLSEGLDWRLESEAFSRG
jgi:hypothetical protein